MRLTARTIAAVALIGAAILVGPGASPAMASIAAPHCESSTSHFVCSAFGGWSDPVTWTITFTSTGGGSTTYQVVTTGPNLSSVCTPPNGEQIFYSFFDGTQTQTSGTARFRCSAAAPA